MNKSLLLFLSRVGEPKQSHPVGSTPLSGGMSGVTPDNIHATEKDDDETPTLSAPMTTPLHASLMAA